MIKRKGQIFVELVFAFSFLSLFLVLIIEGARFIALKQRAHSVARLGSWLKGTHLVSDADTLKECRAYVRWFGDPGFDRAIIKVGQFKESPASRFYDLVYAKVVLEKSKDRFPAISEQVVLQRASRGSR